MVFYSMRKLKFRAWDTVNKKMITPFLILHERGLSNYSEVDSFYDLMQYTGLKDKNGKEIYEGDILEEEPGYYFEVVWSEEWAKFKLQHRTKAVQYPEWNRGVNMTVIGNKWDNPELLKEKSI